MGNILETAEEIAKSNWHKPIGFISASAIVVCSLITFIVTNKLWEDSVHVWWTILFAPIIIYLIWTHTRVAKAKRNKFGIGIALSHEETSESARLHTDFVDELRKGIKGSNQLTEIQFINYPQKVAREIEDIEAAKELMANGRLQFLLWGKIRNRPIGADHKNKDIIDLQGLIRHEPVDDNTHNTLKKEFFETLPKRLVLDPNTNLLGCEISGHLVHSAAKYMIGVMLAHLGYFEYAEKVFLDLINYSSSESIKINNPPSQNILKRTRKYLGMIYEEKIRPIMADYQRTRDRKLMEEMQILISKIRNLGELNYITSLTAAMCTFVLDKDVKKAREEIDRYKNPDDNVWMFSMAFLSAYEGNLDDAYKHYNKALGIKINDPSVPLQCEEFIQKILEEEPEMAQLYYCLGIINYKFKKDYTVAIIDFEHFIKMANNKIYSKQIADAKRWIQEIRSKIKKIS